MTYAFDPELAAWVAGLPATDLSDVAAARAHIAQLMVDFGMTADVSALQVTDDAVPETADEPAVPVRVYVPRAERPADGFAALLYIHGGGFVVGNIDTEHGPAAALATDLGIVVVSVDYRLAPEHPFPAGPEDCYRALGGLHEQSAELRVDPARVGVFGQSAGGGLAAAVALMARDRGGPPLCFQYLGIPELDDRL